MHLVYPPRVERGIGVLPASRHDPKNHNNKKEGKKEIVVSTYKLLVLLSHGRTELKLHTTRTKNVNKRNEWKEKKQGKSIGRMNL